MREAKHSPLPWVAEGNKIRTVALEWRETVCDMAEYAGANAEFIVRACNAHHDLVAVCESAVLILERLDSPLVHVVAKEMRVALGKAKGGAA